MNIQEQMNVFREQAKEIGKLFPAVSSLWFEIKDIPYNEFIAFCEEKKKNYDVDSSDRLRICFCDYPDITVWLYTKKLKINKRIDVEELETA